jgi:hypothetical protein
MFDPDDFTDPDKKAEIAELDKLLSKLQDCDLGAWDQDFIDGLVKRLALFPNCINITPRQWEQLERLRSQYNA